MGGGLFPSAISPEPLTPACFSAFVFFVFLHHPENPNSQNLSPDPTR